MSETKCFTCLPELKCTTHQCIEVIEKHFDKIMDEWVNREFALVTGPSDGYDGFDDLFTRD